MKQIIFYLTIFLGMFLLQSCLGARPSDEPEIYKSTINYSNDHSGSPELLYDFSNNETFESFVQKFSLDTLFQVNRIEFPLNTIQLNEDFEEIEIWVEEKDWRRVVFEETEDYSMTAFTNRDGEEGYVNFKGIENGIAISFTFQLNGGEWYLVKMADRTT